MERAISFAFWALAQLSGALQAAKVSHKTRPRPAPRALAEPAYVVSAALGTGGAQRLRPPAELTLRSSDNNNNSNNNSDNHNNNNAISVAQVRFWGRICVRAPRTHTRAQIINHYAALASSAKRHYR